MGAKAGYKGKVKIGNTTISGMATWTYSGSTRPVEDDSEFGDAHQTFIPMQIAGGDVTISGNFLMDEDAGQQLLRTYFIAGTEITNLKLYINETSDVYYTLDSTLTPASFATITKLDDVNHSKAALMSFSCAFKISGMLKLNATSSEPGVETIGGHDPTAITVEAIGELTGMGGEVSLDCYFEYGTTTSYGSDTSVSADTLTEAGLFHIQITGLSGETTYHMRAVAEDGDSNKYYGEDKTFTTTA